MPRTKPDPSGFPRSRGKCPKDKGGPDSRGRSATRPCTSQGNPPSSHPLLQEGAGGGPPKGGKQQQPHENNLNQQNKTDQQEGSTLSHAFCIQALGD